jgi:hypothetical protein
MARSVYVIGGESGPHKIGINLQAASTLRSMHGTDRTEVVLVALDAYFERYPEVIAQVCKAMGMEAT